MFDVLMRYRSPARWALTILIIPHTRQQATTQPILQQKNLPMIVSITVYNTMFNTMSSSSYPNPTYHPWPGLSYVYLTWVYFLFYLGAGYPTHYYPYIISTLLNFVPTECGGTGQWMVMWASGVWFIFSRLRWRCRQQHISAVSVPKLSEYWRRRESARRGRGFQLCAWR